MTTLERCIRTAQHRLWLNDWIHRLMFCTAIAGASYAAFVLVTRLYGWVVPYAVVGACLGAGALLVSLVWATLVRPSATVAAARLDNAAGLRERVSSGRYCLDSSDPFAQAVVADADRVAANLSVRQHIPLTLPASLPCTAGSIALAALMFLVTPGLLKSDETAEDETQSTLVAETHVAVKRQMDAVRKMAETNPALEEFKDKLGELDKDAGGNLKRPADIRHSKMKRLDKLVDAVKKKRANAKYGKAGATRKMLRGIKTPESTNSATRKLTKSLAQGDFKSAREELKKLQETLATLKSEQDKEMVAKLSKQLAALAKQLDQTSKSKKLKEKLEQAGVKPEDIERMLENLKKKDLDQLKKQLEKSGMNQQQIEKLAKQLQQQQQGGSTCKNLSTSINQASTAMISGQMGEAMAGLQMADAQLSELEQLEQEMSQLDAAAAAMQNAKDNIDKPCSACKGSGMSGGKPCSLCQGSGGKGAGGGMGKMGRGRGGLAPERETSVGFKIERAKVKTGQGAIIGQFFFKGEQVKGAVDSSLAEMVTAAERDATDLINRDRIPRQYQKAVKAYFSQVKDRADAADDTNGSAGRSSTPATKDE